MLMTTADLLRLAMAAVVVVGGAVELKRMAAERAALLAAEQERSQRLEELATLKADFTAMVAHEFGHPLSAIRRLTEMLARDGLDPGLKQQVLTTILKETDALDRLVGDMQTSAAVERDDFTATLRPVEVGELIQNAVVYAESHDPDRSLVTAVDGLDPQTRVLADPDRIGQVLRNLLCNAAKYTPRAARISLRATPAGSDAVRLEVADSGPGIHPDDVPRIFEKFGRGRNGTDGVIQGAGMGLYLSQRLVRAHGSRITVRSRPGAGSVFAFELARAPEAA
jgi:signal transduction histidine kinase